jgi:hypothetical protein
MAKGNSKSKSRTSRSSRSTAKRSSGTRRASRPAPTPEPTRPPEPAEVAEAKAEEGVATQAENDRLEHTRGGTTTRDDALDAGVPMEAGAAHEPVGPEDALGRGPKRGDYSERVVGSPHESRPIDGGGAQVTQWVDRETGAAAEAGAKGAIEVPADNTPRAELEPQAPRASDVGEVEGRKGGVDSLEAPREAAAA